METSTPVNERREARVIDVDDSPIGSNSQSTSQVPSIISNDSDSTEVISTTKNKAGISNEVNSMAMPPPQEYSPDTMEKRLVLHSMDIIRASVNNDRVKELHESETHTLDLSVNPFARRSDGTIKASMTGMMYAENNAPNVDGVDEQSVGLDGMNKDPLGGGASGLLVWME